MFLKRGKVSHKKPHTAVPMQHFAFVMIKKRWIFAALLRKAVNLACEINKLILTMKSKRTLKRTISVISGELLAEAVAMKLYSPKAGKNVPDELICSILKMQDEYLRRVCHPEPGMKAKLYYKDLRGKFSAQVLELADQISNL